MNEKNLFTKKHLAIFSEASRRITELANQLPDNDVSFSIELCTRTFAVWYEAIEWEDEAIVKSDFYCYRLDSNDDGIRLFNKITEWEKKYGLQQSDT